MKPKRTSKIAAWFGAHPLRPAVGAIFFILVLGSLGWTSAQPRDDRAWYPYLAHTSDVEIGLEGFSIEPVSDWSYVGPQPIARAYRTEEFAFGALKNVWFVVEPQPGLEIAAHTLLLFEFEDARIVGLTIEARREAHEDYNAFHGLFNAYELSYVWASARDLLTRRVVMLEHDVFVYPLALSDNQKIILLRRLLERTRMLEDEPRFYNTITSNCTNELAKATVIPWHYAFVLTGLADQQLFKLGLIPGDDFGAVRETARLTDFILQANALPSAEFNRALLAELDAKNR